LAIRYCRFAKVKRQNDKVSYTSGIKSTVFFYCLDKWICTQLTITLPRTSTNFQAAGPAIRSSPAFICMCLKALYGCGLTAACHIHTKKHKAAKSRELPLLSGAVKSL